MYRDTITLFNRYRTAESGVLWYPTIIKNVDLNIDRAAIIAKYGVHSADNASLHIRYSVDKNGNIVIADRVYLLPKAWANQTDDSLPRSITFAAGQDFDFFWAGEWSGEAIIIDSDYDGFYNHMNKKYDQIYAITGTTKYSVIPHFEILGK